MTLREICFIGRPSSGMAARVRQGQMDALVRQVPLTVLVNITAVIVMTSFLLGDVPPFELLVWAGAIAGLCIVRYIRIVRLRTDPRYAARKPPTIRTAMPPIMVLSALWTFPVFLWFDLIPASDKVVIILTLFSLASAASVTLSTVPPAALSYVAMVTLAGMFGMVRLDPLTILVLLPLFATLLSYAVVWNARQFAAHFAATLELREKAELVNLLREFDASGSEWLWELGPDRRVMEVSTGLADALGVAPEELIGKHALEILDPKGQVAGVSAGMRTIIDALEHGRPFRDIAIPARNGGAWWSLSGKPLLDESGRLAGWRGVGSDITSSRLSGTDSNTSPRHDVLTGLPNRLLVRELLEEALLRRAAGKGGCALMLVDLDRFKLVNDTLGHEVGDKLLCEVARRLEDVAPAQRVGRVGGDEFALVLSGADSRSELTELAERIIGSLSAPYRICSSELHIGATIGIAIAPHDGITQEALTRSADLALYSAKKAGRGGIQFFAAWMAEQAAANRALESDLRSALQAGELRLAYQPIVNAGSHRIVSREALLRWTHPMRGEVPPDLFVPVIEDAGLIGQVGNWVLREAAREAATWTDASRVSVNVSSAQLAAGSALVIHVMGALADSGLAPERLELEVTESIFLADDPTTRLTLEQLRALGVRLVLDDFGKGYCNFASLTNGEFTKVKIDRSFTQAAAQPDGRSERAIVEAILTLARGLRLEVTAEGVETAEQAALMVALGCSQLQGYLFGRPQISTRRCAAGEPPQAPLLAERGHHPRAA